MDPRFLQYYNRELQFLREMGAEFAKEFPKVAARLGLEGLECADPYVERLLEGFAFLAARVQLRIDAEFPRFTQHLLEMVYPDYLSPTPSMAVVQFAPDLTEGSLAEGFVVPRDAVLRSLLGKGDPTPCEYRTAHDVTLWPIELVEAEYTTHGVDLAAVEGRVPGGVKAALRLRLRTTAGLTFAQLALDRLRLFLRGSGELPMSLYERLLANTAGMTAGPARRPAPWRVFVDRGHVRRVGFEDREALLPQGPRSFSGYRLLKEYFTFPERFLFVELGGLGSAVRRCKGNELEVTVLFDQSDPFLERAVDASQFALFCAPAINLFPKRADRIHLSDRDHEHHVVPDRTRPMDFEVYRVTDVMGYGTSADQEQRFLPLYAARDRDRLPAGQQAYYVLRREPRVLTAQQVRQGSRSGYVGSELFVSLVDAAEAPYRSELRQLGLSTLCTNRDLPLRLTMGQGRTDFTMQASAPVEAVRCLAGPTRPQPALAEGETAWRLISQLSLNYLSLTDTDSRQGAAGLRELLTLYVRDGQGGLRKQIEGVRSITSAPVHRRVPGPGPLTFARGLEVTVTFDESAFGGSGSFLLGAVLEQFFARYVSINSFTETVVRTLERGEVVRWPARLGRRPLL